MGEIQTAFVTPYAIVTLKVTKLNFFREVPALQKKLTKHSKTLRHLIILRKAA